MSQNPFASPQSTMPQQNFNSSQAAIEKFRPAAIALMVVASLGLVGRLVIMGIWGAIIVASTSGNIRVNPNEPPPAMIFGILIGAMAFMCIFDFISIYAANQMRQGKRWGLSLTGAILQIVCGGCGLISMGIAIWSIVVLNDASVKAHFNRS